MPTQPASSPAQRDNPSVRPLPQPGRPPLSERPAPKSTPRPVEYVPRSRPAQGTAQPRAAHQAPRRISAVWWLITAVVVIAVTAAMYSMRGDHASTSVRLGDAKRPVPVVVAASERSAMPVALSAMGTVTSQSSVAVRSRVDGELQRVLFREGQTVAKGDVLAEIDPRPFQLQLARAEGQLARDSALLNNARVDVERYRKALSAVPTQVLDKQRALAEQYGGSVHADQSQVDNARLQLDYARITAPIDGRLGLRAVDPGNMIHANDPNGLVTITQLKPINVVFAVPQQHVAAIVARLHSGVAVPVEASDGGKSLAKGTLLAIDNQIDTATGTIKLKAEFPNDDETLFPNQFVSVRLLVDTKQDAVVIPQAAVQRGAKETFVYAVNANSTVDVRPVALGQNDGQRVVVESGLQPGERVVVDGADKLRPGAHVQLMKE